MASSEEATRQPCEKEVAAAHAVYTPRTLRLYDALVLGLSNRLVWRCPTPRILDWYNRHITGNHMEVGVGTGFFLDRCRFPTTKPRLGLLDVNVHCLDAARKRISRFAPEVIEASVLEPIDLNSDRFDSVGLNFVLHCLPGTMTTKAAAFTHLSECLVPGGVLFGSTLLSDGIHRGWLARRLMAVYNRKQIFSNADDSLADLDRELNCRFDDVTLETRGCVALFAGRRR